jgi:hypothetical protein
VELEAEKAERKLHEAVRRLVEARKPLAEREEKKAVRSNSSPSPYSRVKDPSIEISEDFLLY